MAEAEDKLLEKSLQNKEQAGDGTLELFSTDVASAKTPFLNLLKRKRKSESATLSALAEIQEKFGQIPRLIRRVMVDGAERIELDYKTMVEEYWIFLKYENPKTHPTLEEVQESLTLEDADEIFKLITKKLTIRIPEPLQKAIEEETTEPDKKDGQKKMIENAETP